jgi:hypothetical protein
MDLEQVIVFLGVQIDSRHRLDPTKMVVNFRDPGNIFCCNDGCLARTLIGDNAAKMNDTEAANKVLNAQEPQNARCEQLCTLFMSAMV